MTEDQTFDEKDLKDEDGKYVIFAKEEEGPRVKSEVESIKESASDLSSFKLNVKKIKE